MRQLDLFQGFTDQIRCFQGFRLDQFAKTLADRMNGMDAAAADMLQNFRDGDVARADRDVNAD